MFRESDLYDPTWSEDLEAYEDKARENLINLAEKLFDEIPNFRSIARGEDWEHVTIKTKNVNYLFEVPDMRFHEFDPEDLSAYKVYMPQNRMPRVPTYPIFKNLKKNEIAVWKLLFGRVPELRKSGNMYGPYPVVGEDMILVDRFFDLKIKTNFWGENSICDLDSKDSFVNMDLLKIIKDLSSLEGSVNLSSERPLYEGGNFQIKYNDSKHPAKLYEVEVPDYQDSPNEWRQAISREIPEILETARDDYKDMYRIDEEVRGSHLAQAIMRLVPSSCPVPQDILVSALKGDEFEFPGYLGSMTKAAREYIGRFSNFSVEELITEIDQLARYGYLIKIPDEEQNCWYARSRSTKFPFEDLGNIHIDDLNAELMEKLDFLRCKEDITVANFNLLLTELLKHPAVFSTYFENVLEVARKINDISALKKIIDRNLNDFPEVSKEAAILKTIENNL